MKLKNKTVIRRITIAAFLVFNIVLTSFINVTYPSLLQQITIYAFGGFIFALEDSLPVIAFRTASIAISEIICIPSLFTRKSIYKIICNIILQILCVVDIGICFNLVFQQYKSTFNIFEIIIDLLFMGLILYDLLKVYNVKLDKIFKKKKLCKPKSEQNEEQGDDFLH